MEAIFLLRPKRLALAMRGQNALHIVAALVLILGGVDHIRSPEPAVKVLAACGFLAGGALIVTFIFERVRPHHEEAAVAWVEVFSGLVVLMERLSVNVEGKHHLSFLIFNTISALFAGGMLIALGVSREWMARRRAVVDDGQTLHVRVSKLHRYRLHWDDLKSFELRKSQFVIHDTRGAQRTLRVDKFEDSDSLRTWLIDRFQLHHIPEDSAVADSIRQ